MRGRDGECRSLDLRQRACGRGGKKARGMNLTKFLGDCLTTVLVSETVLFTYEHNLAHDTSGMSHTHTHTRGCCT